MSEPSAPTLDFAFEDRVGVLPAIDAGETVDPALVYFRTTPVFEAPEGSHHWLTRSIFVGTAQRHPEGVLLRFFTVL